MPRRTTERLPATASQASCGTNPRCNAPGTARTSATQTETTGSPTVSVFQASHGATVPAILTAR